MGEYYDDPNDEKLIEEIREWKKKRKIEFSNFLNEKYSE